MIYNNESLQEIDNAFSVLERFAKEVKLVEDFKSDVLNRAKAWLELYFRNDFDLPNPNVVFVQPYWAFEILNLDAIINNTNDVPAEIRYSHPFVMPDGRTFSFPVDLSLP